MAVAVEVVGADLLGEVTGPCVFWVVDGTPAAVRTVLRAAGWSGRLRTVTPSVGASVQRRGPSVALLVGDPVLAADHLAQLLPVRVVPVWIGGAFRAGPLHARIGRPLAPAAGESSAEFTDRVADAADALVAEQSHGWWQALRGESPAAAAPAAPDGGWRQRWQRSATEPTRPGIWRR